MFGWNLDKAITIAFFMSIKMVSLTFRVTECADTNFKTVSQCSQSGGVSFVSLYCGYNKMVEIKRAYHGIHKNVQIHHCSFLPGDCTTDMTEQYDLTKCTNRHSCVITFQPKPMLECQQNTTQYLQIEYSCNDELDEVKSTSPTTQYTHTVTDQERQPDNLSMNICHNMTKTTDMAYITSPAFPSYYLMNKDCRCLLQSKAEDKIAITVEEMAMKNEGDQCIDWLLVQSSGKKSSVAVICGAAESQQTVLVQENWLLFHLHTARNNQPTDNHQTAPARRNMKGFRMKIEASPGSDYTIKCYEADPEILNSLRHKNNNGAQMGSMILPASSLQQLGEAVELKSSAAKQIHQLSWKLSMIVLCLATALWNDMV